MRTLAPVFAADLSPLLILSALLLGGLVGIVLAAVATWLPAHLEQGWQAEARAALEMSPETTQTPAWVWSMRGGLPALTALVSLLLALRYGPTHTLGAAWVLAWTLLLLGAIDLKTTYLPDILTLPLMWLGLLLNLDGLFCPLPDAVLGAVSGYLALWVLFWGFKLATGQDGMGYGDFKLLAALGAWFGWTVLPGIAFMAAVLGMLVGLYLHWRHRQEDPDTPLGAYPFGPYLVLAGLLHLLWQTDVFALLIRL